MFQANCLLRRGDNWPEILMPIFLGKISIKHLINMSSAEFAQRVVKVNNS